MDGGGWKRRRREGGVADGGGRERLFAVGQFVDACYRRMLAVLMAAGCPQVLGMGMWMCQEEEGERTYESFSGPANSVARALVATFKGRLGR